MYTESNESKTISSESSSTLTMVDVIILLNAIQEELSRDEITKSLAKAVRKVSDELSHIREVAIQVAQEKDAIRH